MQFISFRVILKRIGAITSLLRDKTVPLRKKALVVFGLVYLFLPVDLIPPILFPFGFIDDLILWVFILWHLKDELDQYWKESEESFFAEDDLRDRTIIETTADETEIDDTKTEE